MKTASIRFTPPLKTSQKGSPNTEFMAIAEGKYQGIARKSKVRYTGIIQTGIVLVVAFMIVFISSVNHLTVQRCPDL